MLDFKQCKPHPALQNYIRGYWLIEAGNKDEVLELIPDGYPELFFTFEGSIQIFEGGKRWSRYAQAGLIGQTTHRFTFETTAFSKVLYVKLYPWTPYSLFKVPSWELNNNVLEVGAVGQSPEFRLLSEQIYASENFEQATALLDTFFLKKLAEKTAESPFIRFAVNQIFASNGTASIQSLTDQIKASRRYVEKLFKEEIGISPKQYARLIRVKKATICMLDDQFNGQINTISAGLDYYDPSHFLKDFKAVVQQTPTEFLQQKLNISKEGREAYLRQWDYS